jgi:hypothetical protein
MTTFRPTGSPYVVQAFKPALLGNMNRRCPDILFYTLYKYRIHGI